MEKEDQLKADIETLRTKYDSIESDYDLIKQQKQLLQDQYFTLEEQLIEVGEQMDSARTQPKSHIDAASQTLPFKDDDALSRLRDLAAQLQQREQENAQLRSKCGKCRQEIARLEQESLAN